MAATRPDNVIILTGGLTGSSALAGLLAAAGFWSGENTFRKRDYNTYENSELIRLNRQLMQRAFFLNPFPSSDYHADYAAMLALDGEHEAAEEHFVVSGETGLMYTAVRIANAAHLEEGSERIGPSLAHFVAGFRQAWQPLGEPALADVLEWAAYTLPLNRPEHMEWLRQGLRQMLEPSWPEAPGSRR